MLAAFSFLMGPDSSVGPRFEPWCHHHPVRCFGVLQRLWRKAAAFFISAQIDPGLRSRKCGNIDLWSPVPKFPFLVRFYCSR